MMSSTIRPISRFYLLPSLMDKGGSYMLAGLLVRKLLWAIGIHFFVQSSLVSANPSGYENKKLQGQSKVNIDYLGKQQKLIIGPRFVVGVKSDGSVWSWGTGYDGELGQGAKTYKSMQPGRLSQLSGVVEVSYVMNHVLALRNDGAVFGWGRNQYMQLGKGPKKIEYPVQLEGFKNIVKIVATAEGAVLLDRTGRVFYQGKALKNVNTNSSEIIGIEKINGDFPVGLIGGISGFGLIYPKGNIRYFGVDPAGNAVGNASQAISFSDAYVSVSGAVLLSRDGEVYAASISGSEILGQGKEIKDGGLQKVPGLHHIKNLAYAGGSALALDESGKVWQWGRNVEYLPDPGGKGISRVYSPESLFNMPGVVDVYAGPLSSAIFLANGAVYFVGSGDGGVRGKEWNDHYPSKKEWTQPEKVSWTWK